MYSGTYPYSQYMGVSPLPGLWYKYACNYVEVTTLDNFSIISTSFYFFYETHKILK